MDDETKLGEPQGHPRHEVVRYYRKAREQGTSHESAVIEALHEVRRCSEHEARQWVSAAQSEFDTREKDAIVETAVEEFGMSPGAAQAAAAQAAQSLGLRPLEPELGVCVPHGVRDCEVCVSVARTAVTMAEREVAADDPETASVPESGRWEFDDTVTSRFDDMLKRSIPNYEDMREMTKLAALQVLKQVHGRASEHPPTIVDLGASRGGALQPIVDAFGARGRYTAVEISGPMLEALEKRFEGYARAGIVNVAPWDLRLGFPTPFVHGPPTVVLAVLTLQFIPIEFRQRLLRETFEQLLPGGALVAVEKVLGETQEATEVMVELHHARKRAAGYTAAAIDRKACALEGVLIPLTASMNEQWLRSAGFEVVETIWSWANFRMFLAVKR